MHHFMPLTDRFRNYHLKICEISLWPIEQQNGWKLCERVSGHVFEYTEHRDKSGAAFANHDRNASNVGYLESRLNQMQRMLKALPKTDFGSERSSDGRFRIR